MTKVMKKVGFVAANILMPVLLFAGVFVFSGDVAAADVFDSFESDKVSTGDLTKTIKNWIDIAAVIMALVAVVFIVVAGFQWMTGGEEGVKKAKSTIKNAIIGLVIVVFSWFFFGIVMNLLSVANKEIQGGS